MYLQWMYIYVLNVSVITLFFITFSFFSSTFPYLQGPLLPPISTYLISTRPILFLPIPILLYLLYLLLYLIIPILFLPNLFLPIPYLHIIFFYKARCTFQPYGSTIHCRQREISQLTHVWWNSVGVCLAQSNRTNCLYPIRRLDADLQYGRGSPTLTLRSLVCRNDGSVLPRILIRASVHL